MAKRHHRTRQTTPNVQLIPVAVDARASQQAYGQLNGPYGQGNYGQLNASAVTNSATLAGTYRPIQTNPALNNPALLLNANGQPLPGRRQRGLRTPGFNLTGANQIPVDAVAPLQSGGFATTFPPGDPILPVPGMGDGMGGPRAWPYPAGVNIVPQPRSTEAIGFAALRNLSALYEGIQLCEQVYFRILDRLELQFVPRAALLKPGESASDDKWKQPAQAMADWFLDGPDRRQDLHAWMKALLRDLLELDAGAIYHRPTRGQGLYALELVAGETIAPVLDVGGRVAEPPYAAYQQVIYGVPGPWFSRDQMDYLLMAPRTESPYGRSPVERIILRVNQALRKQSYDLARFTDGATPEGVLQTQNQELASTMTVEQAQQWEQMFNALLAGNDAQRVRTKLVPPGFTFQSTRPEAIATEFDRYLLNITVAAFGLTMDEVAMTETSNRSTGQSQENVTYRNAVKPVTDFIARYISGVVRRYDGQPLAPRAQTISRAASPTKERLGKWDGRYLAQWSGIEEPEDFSARAQAYSTLVNNGIIGRTEAKRLLKLPVSPDEQAVPPMITAQNGAQSVVIIEDLLKQRDAMLEAQQAQLETQIQTQAAQQQQLKQQQEQADQLGSLTPEAQQAAQTVQQAQAQGHHVQITTQPNVAVQQLPAGAPSPQTGQPIAPMAKGQAKGQPGQAQQKASGQPAPNPATNPAQTLQPKAQAGASVVRPTRPQAGQPAAAKAGQGAPQGQSTAVVQSAGKPARGASGAAASGSTGGKGTTRYASGSADRGPRDGSRLADHSIERSGDGWDEPHLRGTGADDTGTGDALRARATASSAGASEASGSATDGGRGGADGGAGGADRTGDAIRAGHALAYSGRGVEGAGRVSGGTGGAGGADTGRSRRERGSATGSGDPLGASGVFGVFHATSGGASDDETRKLDRGGGPGVDAHASAAISDEWARWYERALRAAKRGEAQPVFTSALLPVPLASYVGEALAGTPEELTPTPETVRAIFAEARRRETTQALTQDRRPQVTHSGVMVAFPIPHDVAQRIAWPQEDGGEPPEDHHITLAFLGDHDDFTPRQVSALRRVVMNHVADSEPFNARIAHVGTFPPGPSSEGKTPVIAHMDVPHLQPWRAALIQKLKAAGLPVDETFKDYKPHITLKYAANDETLPPPQALNARVQGEQFTLPAVMIAVGNHHETYALGSEQGYGDGAQFTPTQPEPPADRVLAPSAPAPDAPASPTASLLTDLLAEMRATRSIALSAIEALGDGY